MKPKQKPIKANKLKSAGSDIVIRRSPQTMVVLQNSQSSFQAIDWKQIARAAGQKLRSGSIEGFNAIKSAAIPVWQKAKQRAVRFATPYYIRAVSKFEGWNQQFFIEMDSFTMLDEPADASESQPSEAKGNLAADSAGFVNRFSDEWKDNMAESFGGFKRQIFRYIEKAVVQIETAIRKLQGKAYQAVVFEVVNADQLVLIPVSNNRSCRMASASFALSFKPDSLNFSDLFQRLTETRQFFTDKLENRLQELAEVCRQAVRKIFPHRAHPEGDTTRNMFLPLLNKSGFSILANNHGYP